MASNRSVRKAPPAADDELERLRAEAERWKAAARRTADEIADRARTAAEAMEGKAAELAQAFEAARTEVSTGRARLRALEAAHAETQKALEAARDYARALEQELAGQAAADGKAGGLLAAGTQTVLKSGARMRKRMLKRLRGG